MKRILAAVGATALLAGIGIAAAPAASASTSKVATIKAYSWDGYRAWAAPKGFTVPKGSVLVSKTASPGNGMKPGTHKVTSTFKYRTKTVTTGYRTHKIHETLADSCKVTSVDIDTSALENSGTASNPRWYGDVDVTYTGTCTWSAYDSNDNEHKSKGTGSWTDTQYVYDEPDLNAIEADYAIGHTESYVDAPGYVTWRSSYHVTKYGPTHTAHRYRTVKVVKVVNTAVMTRTEWNTIGNGDTLSWVRKVVGSKGTLSYDGYLGTSYEWKNSSGGYTYVWFTDGHVDGGTWYGG